MVDFKYHTLEESDGERKEVLMEVKKRYGFVNNLSAGLAEAPAAMRAYFAVGDEAMKTSFSAPERHVAWFAVNYYNNCHYCMPAHTYAAKAEKIPEDVIETARQGGGYADEKLQALHDFTTLMVDQRGNVDDAAVEAFLAAGYTKQNVFEVILIIAHKTLTNYSNHVLNTPVDEPLVRYAWER